MTPADRGRITRRLVTAAMAMMLAAGMTACASASTTTPSATGNSSVAASSASSSKPATTESSSPTGATGVITLTGTVAEGVESGCVVLTDATGAVLANLMGLDTKAAPIGSTVDVTGEFETDMMTTCQQGKPFTVTDVQVQK